MQALWGWFGRNCKIKNKQKRKVLFLLETRIKIGEK
jgi:hypothetical protein